MSDLQEMMDFWNDFAEEYTEIQLESQLALLDDVAKYMQKSVLFPTISFLDLAGGSGKFIPVFAPIVKEYTLVDISREMLRLAQEQHPNFGVIFLEKDQDTFFKETADQTYDVVFSAMNPVLTTEESLNETLRIAKKGVYLLRLIKDEDQLFSPLEEVDSQKHWMSLYKNWLKRPYHVKTFHYQLEETVDKTFFFDYFEGEYPIEVLESIAQKTFKAASQFKNQRKIVFELLTIIK